MQAFGLTLTTAPGAAPGAEGAATGGRELALELVRAEVLADRWPDGAEAVDRRRARDELLLAVDRHADAGWRIEAPGHGTWIVAPGGRHAAGTPGTERWRSHALLAAQVLPLAATLQGLELLHGAAVATPAGAVVLAGPSGAGKSSVSTHLRAAGAAFLADDAAALDPAGDAVLVHPGPPAASVDSAELARVPPGAGADAELGRDDGGKVRLRPAQDAGARPLAAVVLLERAAAGGDVTVTPHERPVDALLGSTFVPYVQTPGRLERLLDVAAAVERAAAVLRAVSGPGADARRTAEAIASVLADRDSGRRGEA